MLTSEARDATKNFSEDVAAYEQARSRLEAEHLGKWAVFYDRQLAGLYPTFEDAAKEAVRQFGRGPYLIRQIGAASVTLPASVLYNPAHAIHGVRIR